MPPKKFIKIVWKQLEPYRGFPLWITMMMGKPIYAVRVGMKTKASLILEEVHEYVDDHWKTKLN